MRHRGATRICALRPVRRARCSRTAPRRTYARARAFDVRARHPLRRTPSGASAARRRRSTSSTDRRAQAVEIVGAAGIGKTRLLGELAARADARGHIVLSGAGADLERDLPFWVFVDALDEYLASVEPRRLANLDEDVRVELAQIFPSLSDLGRGGRAGALARALPDQPCGARAARAAGGDQAAGAHPRRLPLGGSRVGRPRWPACCTGPPDAGVLIVLGVPAQPRSAAPARRLRAGAASRPADAHRARPADQRGSRGDARP